MKKGKWLIGLIGSIVLVISAIATATSPSLISYQGILLDMNGDPVTDTLNMDFRIYPDSTSGSQLWSETQSGIEVLDGLFNVLLGASNGLGDSVFSGPDRWLGIEVDGGPELQPRTRLASTPYAHRVSTVDGATGGSISGNLAVGGKATIGASHTNTGTAGFVAGQGNSVTANYASISGGVSNTASGANAAINGGNANNATAPFAAVGGGLTNYASGDKATVGGGEINVAEGQNSTIGGGKNNRARGLYSTVAGGGGAATADSNAALGDYSAIGGGQSNIAGGYSATVGGGGANSSSAYGATVDGGWGNTAGGTYSSVNGGLANTASGNFSFAAGHRANAIHDGAFVWADQTNADFSSGADDQFNVRASGGSRIYSNSSLTAGVTMAAGASAWSSVSHSSMKRNIRPVDGKEILSKLAQLPVSRWSYKAQDPGIEHIGPMAQDFYALFGLGDDDRTISTIDPAGIALAGVKELEKENRELKKMIYELRQEIELLKNDR